MFVKNCHYVDLPKVSDARGNLTFIESARHIPFEVKRVFYLYDVPPGQSRGAHAHRNLHQLLICVAGGFDVIADDGDDTQRFPLREPWRALYVPPLIWDTEVDFEPGSVCLVLASDHYDESDYYRDYKEYIAAVRAARQL